MEMSLSQAAAAARRTRQCLASAIKKGRLSGTKDANGEWRIDSAELARVYPDMRPLGQTDAPTLQGADAAVAVLRAKLEAAEAMVDELRRSRDSWQAQAERLALTQDAPNSPVAASGVEKRTDTHAKTETGRRRPFWRSWFGGGGHGE